MRSIGKKKQRSN